MQLTSLFYLSMLWDVYTKTDPKYDMFISLHDDFFNLFYFTLCLHDLKIVLHR